MIPKELFRSLLDLAAPFHIALTDNGDDALTVRHAKNGEISIHDGHISIKGAVSALLPLINAYILDDSYDRGFEKHVGPLDVGKCPDLTITCRKLREPIKIQTQLMGNSTHSRYQDGAYMHVTVGKQKPAIYHLIEVGKGLVEFDVHSIAALPEQVLRALAAAGCCDKRFDPSALYAQRYGDAALQTAIAAVRSEDEAFVETIIAALNK